MKRVRSPAGTEIAANDYGLTYCREINFSPVFVRPPRPPRLLVLNDDDVIDLLKAAVKREGGQSAFAKRHDVNRTQLNSILNGWRRISARLAKTLGLRRVYVIEQSEEHSERLSVDASACGCLFETNSHHGP
jgi:hypothetical protein